MKQLIDDEFDTRRHASDAGQGLLDDYQVVLRDGEPVRVDIMDAVELLPQYIRLQESVRIARENANAFVEANPGLKGLLQYLGRAST